MAEAKRYKKCGLCDGMSDADADECKWCNVPFDAANPGILVDADGTLGKGVSSKESFFTSHRERKMAHHTMRLGLGWSIAGLAIILLAAFPAISGVWTFAYTLVFAGTMMLLGGIIGYLWGIADILQRIAEKD